jgi:ferrochelatase
LFVLTTRPKASAARYRQIWMREGSPLRVYTERQALLARGYLGDRGCPVVVDFAMRYGTPGIAEKMQVLKAEGCERILLLPLYPQYSSSTTATAFDAAFKALARMRDQPEIRTIRDFHDDPGYVRALEALVRDWWTKRGRPEVLVMSFHGAPRRTLDLGDPYYRECLKTARLLGDALGLDEPQYRVSFQSRFGAAEWLKPYTVDVLAELARDKLARVDVICPGFTSDCLETLEEIAIEARALYTKAGGGELGYIPCLNDRHEWISALTDMIERHLSGWSSNPSSDELKDSRLRALGTGAHG